MWEVNVCTFSPSQLWHSVTNHTIRKQDIMNTNWQVQKHIHKTKKIIRQITSLQNLVYSGLADNNLACWLKNKKKCLVKTAGIMSIKPKPKTKTCWAMKESTLVCYKYPRACCGSSSWSSFIAGSFELLWSGPGVEQDINDSANPVLQDIDPARFSVPPARHIFFLGSHFLVEQKGQLDCSAWGLGLDALLGAWLHFMTA